MVHLHNGILCRKKKEGAPTLCDSMDGSGEHYARLNRPSGKRQIPYDLTYKWNLIKKKKKNKQAKWKRDIEIKKKLTVTRGEVGEDIGGKREGSSRNMYKGHLDKAKGGWDGGWEVGMTGVGGSGGGKMETNVHEQQ